VAEKKVRHKGKDDATIKTPLPSEDLCGITNGTYHQKGTAHSIHVSILLGRKVVAEKTQKKKNGFKKEKLPRKAYRKKARPEN